jgi:hypothetical protein
MAVHLRTKSSGHASTELVLGGAAREEAAACLLRSLEVLHRQLVGCHDVGGSGHRGGGGELGSGEQPQGLWGGWGEKQVGGEGRGRWLGDLCAESHPGANSHRPLRRRCSRSKQCCNGAVHRSALHCIALNCIALQCIQFMTCSWAP